MSESKLNQNVRVDALREEVAELLRAAETLRQRSMEVESAYWAKREEIREHEESVPEGSKKGWGKSIETWLSEPPRTRAFELQREHDRHARVVAAINEQHDYMDRRDKLERELSELPHAVFDEYEATLERHRLARMALNDAEKAASSVVATDVKGRKRVRT